jgi:betaine-aldehyde dehydrogenase
MATTIKEPIGVVAIITLWNFPFIIISQKLPFAVVAGCTRVVKPSELTFATTLMPGEILEASGMPAGVVNIIAGHGNPTGDTLIKDPVKSSPSRDPRRLGKHAMKASADRVPKVALELGSKNPHIVFGDTDLENALDAVLYDFLGTPGPHDAAFH